MHDRQTEILCMLERIERLLMRLCNNTSKDGFYYVPVPHTGDRQGGAKDELEITPQMVEAGFQVLCNSGIADGYLAADKTLVAEIWLAMNQLSPASGTVRSGTTSDYHGVTGDKVEGR